MAPSAALIGSKTKGKDKANPTMIVNGSSNVFVNGVAAAMIGSAIVPHKRGKRVHGGVVSQGSSSVFINGLAAARIGDPISCGDEIADGSSDVFIGG